MNGPVALSIVVNPLWIMNGPVILSIKISISG